ncbi:hypothetical protein GCM10027613_42680 [Microlunatus endophyticus]
MVDHGTDLRVADGHRPDATAELTAALQQRILVLDGAMGTMVQRHKFSEADYRGERFADWHRDVQGNNDLLVLTQPDVIRDIHTAYLEAGADIVETDTFNAQRVSLADYGMEELAYELNVAAARLAREACDAMTARIPDRPRYVAGALGPLNRTASISPTSTTLAPATSISIRSSPPTWSRSAVCSTVARTSCRSKRSSTPSMPRPRSSRSRRSSKSSDGVGR